MIQMKKIFIYAMAAIMLTLLVPATSLAAIQMTPKQNPVSTDKEWKITFNKSVDEKTISKATVYVLDAKRKKQSVTAKVSPDNPRVVLVPAPSVGYVSDGEYTLYIKDTVKSASGKKLTDGVEMKFNIGNAKTQDIILGTWQGEYTHENQVYKFQATFNKEYTSVVTMDDQTEVGVYKISYDEMTMTLLGETRTGKVDKVSNNEFTITSASGKVMRFTR